MKKLFLTLIMLGLVSNMPAFALKLIVNDQTDRVVYSRSSKPGPDEYIEENYTVEEKAQVKQRNVEAQTYNTNGVQAIEEDDTATTTKSEFEQLKKLSESLKPEMIGTTWYYDYSEYQEQPQNQEEYTQEPAEEEIAASDTGVNNEFIDENQNLSPLDLDPTLKKSSREAADYYTQDLNDNNPDLIPSGYESEI